MSQPKDRTETPHAGSTVDGRLLNQLQRGVVGAYTEGKRGELSKMFHPAGLLNAPGAGWFVDSAGSNWYAESASPGDIAFLPFRLPPGAWIDKVEVRAYSSIGGLSISLTRHDALDTYYDIPTSTSPDTDTWDLSGSWETKTLYPGDFQTPKRMASRVSYALTLIAVEGDDRIAGARVYYRMSDGGV